MTTIAIIGAGPGLGLATARRCGREGFSVALISRSQDKLDRLVNDLCKPTQSRERTGTVSSRGPESDVRARAHRALKPRCIVVVVGGASAQRAALVHVTRTASIHRYPRGRAARRGLRPTVMVRSAIPRIGKSSELLIEEPTGSKSRSTRTLSGMP
ncbi:SDR family NAD(P)-dependent oxidoreductase [Nocardia sp. AG03]|uniref:SDR family NAD(P)-dependent oxidoreductase n=1 Tax=Nocardia sp. AG03 TaxID=3025312 RepID=UPI0024186F5C|nr:SDR family NAD(P)-dependent oxidoreductase [Nocardia sp. AG03]